MVEIIAKADPHAVEDIPRDYEPDEVREWDLTLGMCASLGIFPPPELRHWPSFRVLAVYAVSKADANKIKALYTILGPGTGEGALVLAPYDWAWVQDYRERRPEQMRQRKSAQAARHEDWSKRMNQGLEREAHEQMQRKAGNRTTIGYGGMTQRS